MWNSLVWGREILAKGIRWCVGDGSSINIYNDQWIPRASTFKILYSLVEGGFSKVEQLITPSGGWDLQYLEHYFCADDVLTIISIPISSR